MKVFTKNSSSFLFVYMDNLSEGLVPGLELFNIELICSRGFEFSIIRPGESI